MAAVAAYWSRERRSSSSTEESGLGPGVCVAEWCLLPEEACHHCRHLCISASTRVSQRSALQPERPSTIELACHLEPVCTHCRPRSGCIYLNLKCDDWSTRCKQVMTTSPAACRRESPALITQKGASYTSPSSPWTRRQATSTPLSPFTKLQDGQVPHALLCTAVAPTRSAWR